MNWDNFKTIFLKFITDNNVKNFNQFNKAIGNLKDNKLKGDIYEYFCKMYFTISPEHKKKFRQVLLYSEIPIMLKASLGLPETDMGIDGILIDYNNKVYALQVKFRANNQYKMQWKNLGTFAGLVGIANIDYGIFFSNCVDVCNILKSDKYIHILFHKLNNDCDSIFWENVINHIKGQPLKKYYARNPRSHQIQIIEDSVLHYKDNINGKLLLACGTGKTFMSYYISVKKFQFNKIFIVVPSLYLLTQTYAEWFNDMKLNNEIYDFILIGSSMNKNENYGHPITTDEKVIANRLNNATKIVTIVTYQSSNLLINVCEKNKFKFDFGIYDEAHRTVGFEDKEFTKLVKSNIVNKRLFMTATEKIYELSDDKILSMNNEKIYGKTIFKYNIGQAIKDKVLVDYKIIAPFITSDIYDKELLMNKYVNNDGERFDIKTILTGIMICSAMEEHKFKHLLIFCGNNEKAKNILDFIKIYIEKSNYSFKNIIECQCLTSKIEMSDRNEGVNTFIDSKYGIISSSRIFGEGVNLPICDAVCFADGKSSTSDIIQYLCRCLRTCESIPHKVAHILIPCLLDESINIFDSNSKFNNKSFEKVTNILKAIIKEDADVRDKFVVINHNPIVCKDKKDKSDVLIHVDTTNFDVDKFAQTILSRVFDKSGDIINIERNMLIFENMQKYNNGDELIDTQNKCIEYFKKKNMACPMDDRNWVKYCLGEKLFNIIKQNYYDKKEDIIESCNNNGIVDMETYEKYYTNDCKLPIPEYINNNFYDGIFRINDLMDSNITDF